jgi:FKBP-type peptidyl-prolyl cis-trans isomerase
MRPASLVPTLALGLVATAFGCTSLTAPPTPEPINTDSAQVTAPAPRPTQSAAPAMSAQLAQGALARLDAGAAAPGPEGKLEINDLTVGKGKAAARGQKLSVHYVGKLTDGTEFDSSRPRGKPFEFELGRGDVIRGWDQGLAGMKVGGKRKLTIPPTLGYGVRGSPPKIPPNSTLVFEIELLDAK